MAPDPAPDAAPRRWWLGAAAGAVLAGVAVHNARSVRRAVARADGTARALDHAANVGEGLGRPLRLAVLGDSSAAGHGLSDASVAFPRQLATRLAKTTGRRVEITSLAREGARTADVVVTQVPRLRRLAPDVVACLVGVNDALDRALPRSVAADTRRLADVLEHTVPGAAVAVAGCPNLRHAPGLPRPLNLLVGLACRRVAGVQRRVLADRVLTYVDLYGPIAPEDFGPDGFHPGAQGCGRIAERVVDALSTSEATWTSD